MNISRRAITLMFSILGCLSVFAQDHSDGLMTGTTHSKSISPISEPHFQWNVYGEYSYCGDTSDIFGACMSFGLRFTPNIYLGVLTGYKQLNYFNLDYAYYDGEVFISPDEEFGFIPVCLDAKAYMPCKKVAPFLDCAIGGYIGIGDAMSGEGGFCGSVGAGMDVRRFSFGIGYNYLSNRDVHGLYLKVGVRLGK